MTLQVFLWGPCAEKADEESLRLGDILVCQNASIEKNSKLGTTSLHCSLNTKIYVNPKEKDFGDIEALRKAKEIDLDN